MGELLEKFPHTPLKSFLSKIIQLDWFAKFVYGGTPRTSSPTKKAKRRNKCAVVLYLSSSLNFHFLPFVRVLLGVITTGRAGGLHEPPWGMSQAEP